MLVNETMNGKEEESRDLVSVDSTDQSIYRHFGYSYPVAIQTLYFDISIMERPQRRGIDNVVPNGLCRTCTVRDLSTCLPWYYCGDINRHTIVIKILLESSKAQCSNRR